MSDSRCCFKAGKYFLEGKEYKNAISRMPLLPNSTTKKIDLVILFFKDYVIEEFDLDIIQFISKIKEHCDKLDTLPNNIKRLCVDDYIHWRDNILPQVLAEERMKGEKATLEPYIDEVNSVFEFP